MPYYVLSQYVKKNTIRLSNTLAAENLFFVKFPTKLKTGSWLNFPVETRHIVSQLLFENFQDLKSHRFEDFRAKKSLKRCNFWNLQHEEIWFFFFVFALSSSVSLNDINFWLRMNIFHHRYQMESQWTTWRNILDLGLNVLTEHFDTLI